jgi:signal transduction histidine kinase
LKGRYISKLEYPVLLAGAFLLAMAASWSDFGQRVDNDAYDFLFQRQPAPEGQPQSAVLALDDASLKDMRGVLGLRGAVAESLELLKAAAPRAVALDVIFSDPGEPAADARLEAAIRNLDRVVLPCDLMPDGKSWEDPLPRFRAAAAGVGHVHAEPNSVSREILLEKRAARERRWALALEAFRVAQNARILETPSDVEVAGVVIPASLRAHRALWIRYLPPERPVPEITLRDLRADPSRVRMFTGKTVFVGSTSQLVARDRMQTPYSANSVPMPGVEIHANVYETIARGMFLTTIPLWATVLFAASLVAAAGWIFARFSGWTAYALAGVVLGLAHLTPWAAFTQGKVLSFMPGFACAWLGVSAAASYRYFVVRHRMLKAELERLRYQQAMHFVTHEMRTPLTAIQGSSELIGRYAMTDEKRKQIAQLINSESKRLGKMIEIFLSVERLSAGLIEMKREPFDGFELMRTCVERVRPLAERKKIGVTLDADFQAPLEGDRELMEYAFYNLLTNAVKYSPKETEVRVYARRHGGEIRISVQDQGIGMDSKEVKQIFQKFYRTRRAEESGEAGTGIGLSIVEQIVTQHGGRIEVSSTPGKGSCFTLVLGWAGFILPRIGQRPVPSTKETPEPG